MGLNRPSITDLAHKFVAFRAAQIGDSVVTILQSPPTAPAPAQHQEALMAKKPTKKTVNTAVAKRRAKKPADAPKVSRNDEVIGMLKAAGGTTVEAICAATGMLPHSARSLVSTIGKSHTVTKTKSGGEPTVYAIAAKKAKG